MSEHEQERSSRLDEFVARPRRAVWVLAAPMMAGFMVHALYAIADAAFIGRLGADALAAATYVGALVFFAIAIATGLSIGVTAVIAQAIGRRDKDQAERLAGNAIALGLVIGTGLCALGLVFGQQLMPVLGAQGKAAHLAWEYFQVISLGMPLLLTSWVLRAILSGEGEARIPMFVLTVATLLNLALDPLLIFVWGLGVRGAALASLISQGVSVIAYLYAIVWKGRTYLRLRLAALLPRKNLLAPILEIGAPTAAGQIVLSVAAALVNRLLAEYGQNAVAGYGAGSKVDMLVALPVIGLSSAAVSIIGMFAGAGRVDLVRTLTVYTCKSAVVLATILGLAAFIASHWIIQLFVPGDPHAMDVGRSYLAFAVFAYPLMSIGMAISRILQGLGRGTASFVITVLRLLIVGVPCAALSVFVFRFPIEAVWISLIAGSLISNILGFAWLRRYVFRMDPTCLATREPKVEIPTVGT